MPGFPFKWAVKMVLWVKALAADCLTLISGTDMVEENVLPEVVF